MRRIAQEIDRVRQNAPTTSLPNSPWRTEEGELRRTADGSGVERADLLADVHAEMRHHLAAVALRAHGMADLYEAAAHRDDYEVNVAALGDVVRALADAAALVYWVMGCHAGPSERLRRYLRWVISDLRKERMLVRRIDGMAEEAVVEAENNLIESEKALQQRVASLGWVMRLGVENPNGDLQGPALVRIDSEKTDPVPSITELVEGLLGSGSDSYALLSVGSHSERHGLRTGTRVSERDDGGFQLEVHGFGTIALWTRIALAAIVKSIGEFCSSCGIGCDDLLAAVNALNSRVPQDV